MFSAPSSLRSRLGQLWPHTVRTNARSHAVCSWASGCVPPRAQKRRKASNRRPLAENRLARGHQNATSCFDCDSTWDCHRCRCARTDFGLRNPMRRRRSSDDSQCRGQWCLAPHQMRALPAGVPAVALPVSMPAVPSANAASTKDCAESAADASGCARAGSPCWPASSRSEASVTAMSARRLRFHSNNRWTKAIAG